PPCQPAACRRPHRLSSTTPRGPTSSGGRTPPSASSRSTSPRPIRKSARTGWVRSCGTIRGSRSGIWRSIEASRPGRTDRPDPAKFKAYLPRDVVRPLLALGAQVVLEDVIAQDAAHHRIFFELVESIREV